MYNSNGLFTNSRFGQTKAKPWKRFQPLKGTKVLNRDLEEIKTEEVKMTSNETSSLILTSQNKKDTLMMKLNKDVSLNQNLTLHEESKTVKRKKKVKKIIRRVKK
mmetsp:Transcript_17129/g.15103  ORF Transcript_17129/g.15103 Transcript_17129/m.15103 type:complete len:105 (+) Transcript_17129:505-819(+)